MAEIEVKASDKGDSYECQVTVGERGGATHHQVTLRKADYERLAGGKATPKALVAESFRVHRVREPKESKQRYIYITLIWR